MNKLKIVFWSFNVLLYSYLQNLTHFIIFQMCDVWVNFNHNNERKSGKDKNNLGRSLLVSSHLSAFQIYRQSSVKQKFNKKFKAAISAHSCMHVQSKIALAILSPIFQVSNKSLKCIQSTYLIVGLNIIVPLVHIILPKKERCGESHPWLMMPCMPKNGGTKKNSDFSQKSTKETWFVLNLAYNCRIFLQMNKVTVCMLYDIFLNWIQMVNLQGFLYEMNNVASANWI